MRSVLLKCRNPLVQRPSTTSFRQLSTSHKSQNDAPSQLAPTRKYPRYLQRTALDEEELKWDLDEMEEEDERHMSSYGWDLHRQQREFFNVMRTLERDAQVLRANRRPFHPPSPTEIPVLVRSTTFAGEPGHPLTPKRTIVVPVALLPLSKPTPDAYATALHNVKVLAGPRWTMDPPKDAGVPSWRHEPIYGASEGGTANETASGKLEEIGKEGYIKISCELFPETQMNLKWCMDALRRLLKEANERATSPSPTSFTDIPLPTQHHTSRLRAHGLGGGSFKAERKRVTLRDFPKEWLPAGARERA